MRFRTHLFVLTVLVFTAGFGYSQDETKRNFTYIARAKALGYVIIEDLWVRSMSAGCEIIYKDRVSVVADIVHFRWKFEEEVPIDGSYSNGYNEYWQKDARNYAALELRYYPGFLQFSSAKIYLNNYYKIGSRFIHTEDLYPLAENEIIRMNSDFYDVGASLGARFGYDWGLDVNVGAAYRNELRNEDRYHKNEDVGISYHHGVTDAAWRPNIRLSFYFKLDNRADEVQ